MSQPNLEQRKKKRSVSRRLLEMAFVAGIGLDKIDPQRKGFSEYTAPNEFPTQQAPTELDIEIQSEGENESSSKDAGLSGSYKHEGRSMRR